VGLPAIVVLGLGSTASAVPPVKEPIAFDVAGQFVYDCGDFNILTNYSAKGHTILFYDKEGNLTRQNDHFLYRNTEYYNSNDDSKRVFGVGEGENLKWTYIGEPPTLAIAGTSFHVNIPGQGVIWIRTGRLVFDLTTFEVIFEAGPTSVDDFFGDAQEAFCEFLS
jgi:hypothetical protein